MINNNKISYFKEFDAFSPFTSEDNVPLLSIDELIILDKKTLSSETHSMYWKTQTTMNKQNVLYNSINAILAVMFIVFLLFKVNGPIPGIVCVVWILFAWFGREWIVNKIVKPS